MNSRSFALLSALFLLSLLIYLQWTDFINPKPATTEQVSTKTLTNQKVDSNSLNEIKTNNQDKIITIANDVLEIKVNTLGGDIVEAKLLKYNESLQSKLPFELLQNNSQKVYIAQSGLVGKNGSDSLNGRANYQVNGDNFKLTSNSNELQVPFTFTKDGITYTKTFILKPNKYVVDVDFKINNHSTHAIEVTPYAQIKHSIVESSHGMALQTYTGGAYSSEEQNYKKYSFKDMEDENLSINTKAGWVAVLQHYFASAWIPPTSSQNIIYTSANKSQNTAVIGIRSNTINIPANDQKSFDYQLWIGPKLQEQMAEVAPHLDLTVDYGWAWFLSKPLFMLLTFVQKFVINWGVAIIIVTLIVKAILYPLVRSQYVSMAKMKMLQPRIEEIKERYGDDRQSASQAMIKLYQDEKVNPMGGCIPIFFQMPIFIALYYMFMEAVELRQAPFFGWIKDLSAQDPYYILPLLWGLSMLVMTVRSPSPTVDPMQKKISYIMPIVFTFLFLNFPAGLVLYYLVSNLITMLQQAIIYRELERKGLHTKTVKKAK